MDGIEIYTTAVNDKGVTDVIADGNGTLVLGPSMALSVLQDLKLMLNFSINFQSAEDFFPEGEFSKNDSIGYLLTKGRADIALGYLYYIVPRLRYGRAMVPLSVETFHVFFHKPSRNAYRNLFREIFTPQFMACLLTLMSLIGLSVVHLTERSLQTTRSCRWKIQEGLCWAIATISQQDFRLRLTTIPIRILILAGSLMSVLLNAYYAAAILAFLTVKNGVLTYEKVLDQGLTMFIKPSVNSTLLYRETVNAVKVLKISRNDSIKILLSQGNHAHLDTLDLFYFNSARLKIPSHEICSKISHIRMSGGKLKGGFYSRNDFPYRNLFNSRLLKIIQVGLAKRYRNVYMTTMVLKCPKKRKKFQDELGIENVMSIFVGLLGFVVLSMIFLFVEMCLDRTRNKLPHG